MDYIKGIAGKSIWKKQEFSGDIKMRQAIYFDLFVSDCPYFNGNVNVNNGYGCDHIDQEERDFGQGKCYCWSCPLGYPADEESLLETDIEWVDGKPESADMEEDSYIIVMDPLIIY